MMVCPFSDSELLLVLQIDHSRIAGHLAAHWGNNEFAELKPYGSMVLAAQEHDGGWWDWEIRPTLNAEGRPIDYIGSTKSLGKTWLDFYRHGIERVTQQDAYAGLIISMHGEGLLNKGLGLLPYMPDLTGDAEVQRFIGEQQPFRANIKEQLQRNRGDLASEEHIWTNFKHMEVFDQMAQFVCNRYPFNSTARKNGPDNTLSGVPVPVRRGVPDTTLRIEVQDETRAIVRPYPFDVDPLVVSFPARLVPNRTYAGQDDFLKYYYKAKPMVITYTICAR
jgi:hypothetical protein